MPKKKKEIELEYIFVDEGEKSVEKLNHAYDILFEATISNLNVPIFSELAKQEVPLIPVNLLSDKDIL